MGKKATKIQRHRKNNRGTGVRNDFGALSGSGTTAVVPLLGQSRHVLGQQPAHDGKLA